MEKINQAITNQETFNDFLVNIDRVIYMRFSSEKSAVRVKALKHYCKRVAYLIRDNYLDDFKHCIIDFFFTDFDSNRQNFFDYLESTYLNTQCRSLKSGFDLISDEILVFHGTDYWLQSYDSSSRFDKNLTPNQRFILCLDSIASLHSKTHGKKYGKVAVIIADKINKHLGVDYLNKTKVEAWLIGRRSPIFVDTSVHREISRRYKPYNILVAVEQLSLAPKGYLTSVIKPLSLNEVHFIKQAAKVRKPKIAYKDSTFDVSLLPKVFREEAKLYCEYKTSKFIDKKRNEQWVVRKDERLIGSETILTATTVNKLKVYKDGLLVPSFSLFISHLIKIANFAINHNKLKPEDLSVFNLIQFGLIRDYFVHLDENQIPIHKQHVTLISTLSPMWNPEFCFFTEYSDIFCERYNVSQNDLANLAIEYYASFKELKATALNQLTQSPDSVKVKNRKILEMENPVKYIQDALNKALIDVSTARVETSFSFIDAILMRNICIISCLSCIPLRSRNWRDMKIGFNPNCECIYKNEKEKVYELSIPKAAFKNYTNIDISDRFVYKFPENVSSIIDDYLNYARPVALRDSEDSRYFLVTSKLNKLDGNALRTATRTFFMKYGDQEIKEGGIGVHFFRDVVATTILKKHPSAYHHAALLLLDSEETVKESYGHLTHKDAFALWNSHLSGAEAV